MYLTNTQPDICFVVNILSRYMVESRHVHLIAVKHVMRYLKGTVDYGIEYVAESEISIQIGPVVLQTRKVHYDVASL
jgi:hypothetical protein